MRIAKVWIEHPVLQLDQVFSYDALQLPAEKGKRVSVDFKVKDRFSVFRDGGE